MHEEKASRTQSEVHKGSNAAGITKIADSEVVFSNTAGICLCVLPCGLCDDFTLCSSC